MFVFCFFFFKQKTAYEISACLVGSEMCIRDSIMMVDQIVLCYASFLQGFPKWTVIDHKFTSFHYHSKR